MKRTRNRRSAFIITQLFNDPLCEQVEGDLRHGQKEGRPGTRRIGTILALKHHLQIYYVQKVLSIFLQ